MQAQMFDGLFTSALSAVTGRPVVTFEDHRGGLGLGQELDPWTFHKISQRNAVVQMVQLAAGVMKPVFKGLHESVEKVPQFVMSKDFRDEIYDHDFRGITDTATFVRGGHEYKRPCGWLRLALNVKRLYGDDKTWLGKSRKVSTASAPGEWPVSYHGTGEHAAKSIAEDGYDLSKGKRKLHGVGIYSTPDIAVAEKHYAQQFEYDEKKYMVVVQNRVNPNTVDKIPKEKAVLGEYWITKEQKDTRAYGICIKEVK